MIDSRIVYLKFAKKVKQQNRSEKLIMRFYALLLVIIFSSFRFFPKKGKALSLSFFLLTMVAVLRKYTVGADTGQWWRVYTVIVTDPSWDFRKYRFEPGFYYLCKILGLIYQNPQIVISLTSIFINYSVYSFIKKNSLDYCLSTILYVITNNYFSNLNVMRQAIAVAILLYGYEYLKRKKYPIYIIFIAVAASFHIVAVAALLWLLFIILPDKRKTVILEVLIGLITFVFYNQFFDLLTRFWGYGGYRSWPSRFFFY